MSTLQELISNSNVVVFSKPGCPFCAKTKDLFKSLNIAYDEKSIAEDANNKLFEEVNKQYNHETLPAVFVKGQFIGGNSDVQAKNEAGELTKMLA